MAAEYPANTTIIKAIPTLLANNVQAWAITYRMTHTAANSYVWSWDWGYHHDVSALNKTRAEFTKTDLYNYLPDMEHTFDLQYKEIHERSTEPEVDNDFDINTLTD